MQATNLIRKCQAESRVAQVDDLWSEVGLTDLVDPAALDAEAVLVDGDDLLVLEDGAVVGLDGAQVDGHEERRRKDGPHRHLRLGLLVAQPEVADDQL